MNLDWIKVSPEQFCEEAGICIKCKSEPATAREKYCWDCLYGSYVLSTSTDIEVLASKIRYQASQKIRAVQHKQQIFDHYGWPCKCCGEMIPEFLQLDHIFNDGAAERKKIKGSFYKFVIDQGFPNRYQTLCVNCNWGKRLKGICPHQFESNKEVRYYDL